MLDVSYRDAPLILEFFQSLEAVCDARQLGFYIIHIIKHIKKNKTKSLNDALRQKYSDLDIEILI